MKIDELIGIKMDKMIDINYYEPSKDEFHKELPYYPTKLIQIKTEEGIIVNARKVNTSSPEKVYGEWVKDED